MVEHYSLPPQQKSEAQASGSRTKVYKYLLRSMIIMIQFRKVNWVQVSERVESCIATIVFKYWNGIAPRPSYNRCNTESQVALAKKQIQGNKLYLIFDQKY